MKEKLEVVTNIVLMGLACVVGYRLWPAHRAPENPPPVSVKAGDHLPSLPAYDWKAHDRTLVLALRNGCRFCEESIPFYRKLAELEKSNQIDAHLIAVFPDDPAVVRQLVETQRLAIEALPGIELSQVKVEGTPTLILVDRQGQVSKVWIGELAAAGQADVITGISRAGAKRPWIAAAMLPPSYVSACWRRSQQAAVPRGSRMRSDSWRSHPKTDGRGKQGACGPDQLDNARGW